MEKRLLEVRCPNQGCYPEASKTAAPNVTVESIPITTVTNIRLETAYRGKSFLDDTRIINDYTLTSQCKKGGANETVNL